LLLVLLVRLLFGFYRLFQRLRMAMALMVIMNGIVFGLLFFGEGNIKVIIKIAAERGCSPAGRATPPKTSHRDVPGVC